MSTVIKFPRRRGRRETPERTGASAVVIILPVVRIVRAPDVGPDEKATPDESVAKGAARSSRKRRKRVTPPALPVPARRRG